MYIYVCTCIYIHIDKYTIRIYTNTHCTYLYAIFAPAAHPSRAAACHRVTNKFFSFFLDMSNFPQVTES